ncbi:hypothetical protein [Shinella zoogloeoides]|uniref:hypothetical protein n=1 Tax=Shinella zoogloeoides TaxID=352475 RepID=UPI00273FFF07|nr:hypothetical protein [Shinella zoogloeoides]WLR92920.1 hypothetical protein Q9316_01550 [Shinella zoogloeoides]
MAENLKLQADPHIKRMACQIYTQLPEDKREALQVLQYVRQIIFCLGEDWEAVVKTAAILPFQHQEMKGPAVRLRAVQEGPNDHQDRSNPE